MIVNGGAAGGQNAGAAPGDHQSQRADSRAETLVRNARVCQPGRQGRLLLSKRGEVQNALRDVGLQQHGESQRRTLWPTAFALKELTTAAEAKIGALVQRAVS